MTTDEQTTEAEVIAEYAIASQSPDRMDVEGGRVLYGAYPPGWSMHQLDLVQYEARPSCVDAHRDHPRRDRRRRALEPMTADHELFGGFTDRHQQAAARGLAAARAELPARDPQHTPDTVVALDPTARAARLRRRAQARTLHRIDQPTGDDAA